MDDTALNKILFDVNNIDFLRKDQVTYNADLLREMRNVKNKIYDVGTNELTNANSNVTLNEVSTTKREED